MGHDPDMTEGRLDFRTDKGSPAYVEGRTFYDLVQHGLAVYNDHTGVMHNLGYEHLLAVYNDTGSTIPNGSPVYLTGSNSPNQLPTVALARADTDATARMVGITTEDIPNNGKGYVCQMGLVHGIDTTAWNLGQILYLSATTAGVMTASNSTDQRYGVRCAVVVFRNLSAGILLVLSGHESTRDILNIVEADLSFPSRAFNTNYTPNATRPTLVIASVRIDSTAALTVTGGATNTGHVELRSDNAATPSREICRVTSRNGLTGTVVIGVAITSDQRVGGVLIHIVPPGQQYRLFTSNDGGSPSFTLVEVSEISL